MTFKALDVFNAYHQNKIPKETGYIISSAIDRKTLYAKFEIIYYYQLKSIHFSNDGLTFYSDGNKIFILFEPAIYLQKTIEPFQRPIKYQIPLRFNELEILTANDSSKVMIGKNPILTYVAFTILKPNDDDFTFFFYDTDDAHNLIRNFFQITFCNELNIPESAAEKAAKIVQEKIMKLKK